MKQSNSFAVLATGESKSEGFHTPTVDSNRTKKSRRRNRKRGSDPSIGEKTLNFPNEPDENDDLLMAPRSGNGQRATVDGSDCGSDFLRSLSSKGMNGTMRSFAVENGLRVCVPTVESIVERRESGRDLGSPFASGLPQRVEENRYPSFASYLAGEMNPLPKELKKDVVRETERDKVYNTIWRVPCHMERVVWCGLLICVDALLGLFAMLPVRCVRDAVWARGRVHPNQLFDRICLLIVVLGVGLHLTWIPSASIYFGMKDITSEFLKITLVHLALDIADKILCNFGVDVLEALSGTCTLYIAGQAGVLQLALDSALAFGTVAAHSVLLMCSAMVWYVAMASSENAMLGFLIVSNFGEIKGTVFKRFDPAKLFSLTCQDIVERFHLVIAVFFILVEDMGQSGAFFPTRDILSQCALILMAESMVDMIKHSVLGKFNDIRPGVYREFLRDICRKTSQTSSHNIHKCVGFEPLGPGVFCIRIIISALYVGWPVSNGNPLNSTMRVGGLVLGVSVMFVVKIGMGYLLRALAVWYQRYFEDNHGRPKTPRENKSKKES